MNHKRSSGITQSGNPGNPKICAFCGKTGDLVKITREHLFPNAWTKSGILPIYPATILREETFNAQKGIYEREKDLKIPMSTLQLQVNAVCRYCNNEILNDKVEVPVAGLIPLLMHGIEADVQRPLLTDISRWCAKTAAVRGLMTKLRPMPDEHYKFIIENLEPPPGTQIWISPCAWNPQTFTRQRPVQTRQGGFYHATTLSFGFLLIHIVGASHPILPEGFTYEAHERAFPGQFVKIWPNPPAAIRWPWKQLGLDQAHTLVELNFPTGRNIPHDEAPWL